uniref:39S ribosomal protein L28, mitochondrial n=1 Tax=Romanomermis culicivorax TaxID=13658 RepID=A0A915K319_ROMCU
MAAAKLAPKPVVTWEKAQRIWRNWDIWRDPQSVVHRLPEHYKRRYWANILADRTPVHYQPPDVRFSYDPIKKLTIEHEHYPVLVIYPPEVDKGLWGGEGILKGYEAYKLKKRRVFDRPKPIRWRARFFWPRLLHRVFYSEIFDKYLKVRCTRRLAELVDQNFGFDYYILRTSELDLGSKLGNKLKREMLLSLARRDYYPNDAEKRKEIEEKYKEFIIPEHEAEWVGLDLNEACMKLQDLEFSVEPEPLKFKFERGLLDELSGGKSIETKETFLSRITPKFTKFFK